MSDDQQVVAVVVTWNRRDLLEESLRATLRQTRPTDRVVVVDNASTDGTDEMLRAEFAGVEVVRATRNSGGAGGFALGIRHALESGPCTVLWLMDDDTVPAATALEALVSARAGYPGRAPALVASRVTWTDGRDHPMNTPRPRPGARRAEREHATRGGCLPIRSASFVSVLVDAEVVRARGLPIADYFLWNDDFEFTTRVIRRNVGLSCPASVVVHKTRTFASTEADPGERFFYEVRNKVWLFTRSRGLSPLEKIGYGGATALRWVRTMARSRDRRTLLACLARGLARGVVAGPRRTADVLAELVETGGAGHE
ncbi:MAG: glycosyltransferase family 2 protein [Actinomycetota bacterium]|nr:glycosyltransferase family 2 protein [Actinomycetota bacterium]